MFKYLPLTGVIVLILILFYTIFRMIFHRSQKAGRQQMIGYDKSNGIRYAIYLIWGLISIIPLYFGIKFLLCDLAGIGGMESGCSDTPGVNSIIGIVVLGFWLLVTILVLYLAKRAR